MQCDHWSECGVRNVGRCSLGLYGGKPSLGVCKQCKTNTTVGAWPLIQITPPPLVPTPKEQAAWLTRVLPICQGCKAFGGVQETPDMKIVRHLKCAKCKTCGSKTVGPMQDCPLEKWKRATPLTL